MKYNFFRKKTIHNILLEADAIEKRGTSNLRKTLTVKDLTAFGLAGIIGAGIFATIGNAAYNGGPAVVFLFLFTSIVCSFAALCYAEFASLVPIAGSTYTYTYIAFGEILAWIAGWVLLLEYTVGNIAVSISWSDYFTSFMEGMGVKIPDYLSMDILTALRGHKEVLALLQNGKTFENIPTHLTNAYNAWETAPHIFGFHFVADIPALAVILIIGYLVYIGIKETRNVSNFMVALKIFIILMIIVIGFFYINPANFNPFAPNGVGGVLKGVSAVFFAYIGFDAISTTAEECKRPQRDLPLGIIYSLIICTILYVLISIVLTGMVSYTELAVGDPLAFVFKKVGLHWLSGVIAFSAVIAMTSALLVFVNGQPRIWMTMSRDGLLPKIFSKIHPKHRTPHIATIVAVSMVFLPILFMNLSEVTDLTSIGTLFAFVLVCGGVLVLQERRKKNNTDSELKPGFQVFYINGKFILPVILIGGVILMFIYNHNFISEFFSICDPKYAGIPLWKVIAHKIPIMLFVALSIVMLVLTYIRNLSLIPVLGLLCCSYLMTELGIGNWVRFIGWMLIGLVIYFVYGYKSSLLNKHKSPVIEFVDNDNHTTATES